MKIFQSIDASLELVRSCQFRVEIGQKLCSCPPDDVGEHTTFQQEIVSAHLAH